MADWQRTHTCGELRDRHIGETVVLNGWVNTLRRYADQVFVDLRDRYGITQVVVEADDPSLSAIADSLGREFCLSVRGTVARRLPGKENPKLQTGTVELKATAIEVLNQSPTPPFEVTEFPGEPLANEDLRMQYRYLDLRRSSLRDVLITRHRINRTIREYLGARDFIEVETPLLGKSTPEGARDYLVPSRIYPGEWYALPQSPQLYKQLLMVGGFDRYFQIARCLRDEDLRADRQPEFTQLDVEMSFIKQNDILEIIEGLTAALFRECLSIDLPRPFPRLTYAEAMRKYGSDKPDLRYGLEIQELSDWAGESGFKIFTEAVEAGKKVRGFNAIGGSAKFSNTDLNKGSVQELVRTYGAKGVAWLKVEGGKFVGTNEKNFSESAKQALWAKFRPADGDLIFMVADTEEIVGNALGALRIFAATHLKLFTNWWERPGVAPTADDFKIAWIVDFPSFTFDPQEQRWVANHHPFTAPRDEDLPYLTSDPGRVLAKAYDLVLNGYEVGGGSIRIHNPQVQSQVFAVLGMDDEAAKSRFGFLLDALKYGAPPHGGIALGLDRWAMILAGTTNIRDVIAFPKNQRARDLMTGAPAAVEPRQLKELGLR